MHLVLWLRVGVGGRLDRWVWLPWRSTLGRKPFPGAYGFPLRLARGSGRA